MRNHKAQWGELGKYAYYMMLAGIGLFLAVQLAPTIIKTVRGFIS